MHDQIMSPYKKHEDVDGENPQHEHKDGITVIGEIVMRGRFLARLAGLP